MLFDGPESRIGGQLDREHGSDLNYIGHSTNLFFNTTRLLGSLLLQLIILRVHQPLPEEVPTPQ